MIAKTLKDGDAVEVVQKDKLYSAEKNSRMPLILSLETATTNCSVALASDGKVIAARSINSGYSHAEKINVFIQEVIDQAGFSLKDLNAIAVSSGPGSYTGLRIGVSTAKGLCYALISFDRYQYARRNGIWNECRK